jgi:signal transduction histidine kinase/CheY-like chemotaxis protein/CHASE3 domain sensor protein/HPt (histidine-containing phosphotransfer) domain-containing protein
MGGNLSILKKGLILISVPLLFQLIFIGAIALKDRDKNRANEAFVRTKTVLGQAQIVLTKLVDFETGTRGFIITGDPIFTEPHDRAAKEVPAALQRLEDLVSNNPEQQTRIRQIKAKAAEMMDRYAKEIQLVRQGARDEAIAKVKTRDGKNQMDDMRKSIDAFLAEEQRLAQQREQAVQRQELWLYWILGAGTPASILTTLLLAFTFTRGISDRLAALIDGAHRFARSEELGPPISGGDEVAQVDQAFRRMVQERKRAEETIQLYADIVKNVPIGLHMWHLDDPEDPRSLRLLDANPAGCSLTGVPLTELRGLTFLEVFPGVSDTDLACYAEVALSRKAKDMGEIQYQDERMAPAYWAVKAFPLPDSCVALAFENVTERRENEEELRRMREQADAANQAKSQFLAHMSHEIRTPLNGILGFAELLRRGERSEEQRATFLDTIRSSGKHLLALIDEVLDLSKIEAGRMEFERVCCSPHQVIIEVLSTLRVASQQKGLSLECRWMSHLPETIVTDPYRLRQLLMNVVGNAIKFTETGGVKILVSAEAEKPEPRFLIEVHDTGIGIAAEQLPRVFQPFNQADGSITRRFGGTGLGLAISQHIAHAMGGAITIESEVGRGSVFRITLDTGPLDGIHFLEEPPSEAFTSSGEKKPRRNSLAPARILLIEDGETNRELIQLVLSEAGASVVCAENGQLGLEAAAHESFDLILMDVQMPVMDGYTATRRLREQGCTTPIIALTAHAMRGDQQKCREAGCTGYLSKPVDIDLLLRTVGEAIGHTCPDVEPTADTPLDVIENEVLEHQEHQIPVQQTGPADVITSNLPTDRPEYRRIVENFVDKLQDKLGAMQVAFDAADLDELAELAHWLKGAGGTIGFDCFTEPARNLEQLAKRRQPEQIGDSIRVLNNLAGRIAVPT